MTHRARPAWNPALLTSTTSMRNPLTEHRPERADLGLREWRRLVNDAVQFKRDRC